MDIAGVVDTLGCSLRMYTSPSTFSKDMLSALQLTNHQRFIVYRTMMRISPITETATMPIGI